MKRRKADELLRDSVHLLECLMRECDLHDQSAERRTDREQMARARNFVTGYLAWKATKPARKGA